MEAPKWIHWEAVCRILRYFKCNMGMGVLYRRRSNSSLSDADWKGKRSISKYCTSVGGNLVT